MVRIFVTKTEDFKEEDLTFSFLHKRGIYFCTSINCAQPEGVSAEDIRDVESSSKTFSLGLVSFISQMGFSGKTENQARNCLTFECDSITSCKGYEGCSTPLLPVTVWLSHFSKKSPNTNYSLDC